MREFRQKCSNRTHQRSNQKRGTENYNKIPHCPKEGEGRKSTSIFHACNLSFFIIFERLGQDHGHGVVDDTFAEHEGVEVLVDVKVVEDSDDSDRVGGGDESTKMEGIDERKMV